MDRIDQEPLLAFFHDRVDSAYQPVSPEDREYVIAVLSFLFGQEHFEVVVEAEDSFETADQIVEGGKQRDPRPQDVIFQGFKELYVLIVDVSLVLLWKTCDPDLMYDRILL